LIGRYIKDATLDFNAPPGNRLVLRNDYKYEIFMFQQLTWHYVILSPSLSTQQHGQKRLIEDLFDFYFKASLGEELPLLPLRWQKMISEIINGNLST